MTRKFKNKTMATCLIALAATAILTASAQQQQANRNSAQRLDAAESRPSPLRTKATAPTPKAGGTTLAQCRSFASACASKSTDNQLACAHEAHHDGVIGTYCNSALGLSPFQNCKDVAVHCKTADATTVNTTPAMTASVVLGSVNGTLTEAKCSGIHRAEAITVRVGPIITGDAGRYVTALELHCSDDTRTQGDWRLLRASNGTETYTFRCDPGQLLSGFVIRAGATIDAIQPKCRQAGVLTNPTTKTGGIYGGIGGTPTTIECSSSPARHVVGLRASFDMYIQKKVVTRLQVLCA